MALKVNFATGFEIPPYFLQNKEIVKRLEDNQVFESYQYIQRGEVPDEIKQELLDVPHFDEVKIKFETEPDTDEYWFTLPLDPVISVAGKNIIVRRNVAKTDEYTVHRGSVKELWSQDDYEINIAGVFIGKTGELPERELRVLKNICEARLAMNIKSKLLGLFGIFKIVIEEFSFPFTKGMENQMYTIKAYSDDNFDLLIND